MTPVHVSSPTPDPSPEEAGQPGLTAALVAELAGEVAVEAAREDLLSAQGAVRVAQARLRESLDATPRVDPRVVAAEAALSTARARAQDAAQLMADRDRELADAEGELRVARAVLGEVLAEHRPQSLVEDDLVDVDEAERPKGDPAPRGSGGRGEPSRVAAARFAVERRRRAVEAAEARLLHSQEQRAAAEGWLGQAEEELSGVLEVSAASLSVESAYVTQARVRLDDVTRAAEAAAARLARLEADPSATVMRAVGPVPAEAGQFQRVTTADTRNGRDSRGSAAGAGAGGEKGPVYASLDAFVEGYVLPQWRHKLGGSVHWCAYWFRHAEAVSRLEAVWEAWEVMRHDPAPAMSTWWRDHLDPHMRMLTDADGVFYRCSADVHEPAHEQAAVWSAHTAPDGLFATDLDAPEQPTRVTRAAHLRTAAGAGEAAARVARLATTFPDRETTRETTRDSASPEEPTDTSCDSSWGMR